LIGYQIDRFAEPHAGWIAFTDVDLQLSERCVYRPDVTIFPPGSLPVDVTRLHTVPVVVVEVSSRSSKRTDVRGKKDDYEAFGVPEYWVVDPQPFRFRAHCREVGLLVEKPVFGDSYECASIPGFVLDSGPLRQPI